MRDRPRFKGHGGNFDSDAEPQNAALTKEQRRFLIGLSEKTGANERVFRGNIRERVEESIYDLQMLLYHLDQNETQRIFDQGSELGGGPVMPADNPHRTPMGFVPEELFTTSVDKNGKPRDPDPEINPDVKTKFEHLIESREQPGQVSPAMQRALIDSVAFLCHAAEMGGLRIEDLIERGVEKHYRRKTRTDNRAAALDLVEEGSILQEAEVEAGKEYPNLSRREMRLLKRKCKLPEPPEL